MSYQILNDDLVHIFSQTDKLWSEIRNKNVFITGGTGFIGTWLLESFVWANDKLNLNASAYVLTRNKASFFRKAPHLCTNKNVSFIEGDILSFTFPEGLYPYIIHAATDTSHALYDDDQLLAFNKITHGMKRILDFAVKAKTEKLLFISSGAVYGKPPRQLGPIPEDYNGAPNLFDEYSVYGEGKRVAEMIGGLYAKKYGVEVKIARCFSLFGPHMHLDRHFALGNFIRDALQGGPIDVKGDGCPYRSYLYAADMVIWLWTILFRGKSCRPYNVGSDDAIQIKELAHLVAKTVPVRSEVHIYRLVDDSGAADRYLPDICRAQEDLGLSVQISLSEGISRTVSTLIGRTPGASGLEVPFGR